MNTAFASGIQSSAMAPATAFTNSLNPVADMMPHSDAKSGPLSQLTASGQALTDTFAEGMGSSSLDSAAATLFSEALPTDTPSLDTSGVNNKTEAGSPTIHIENLYLQANDCETLLDFTRMLMHAVYTPGVA
jgi:hypothetical protein